jgi:hypothetical protein
MIPHQRLYTLSYEFPCPSAAKVLLRHRFADSVLNQSSRRQCLLRYRLVSPVGVLCFSEILAVEGKKGCVAR